MEKIVSLAKRRGFIFPGSEIYGGLAGTYDWGPLGVALKSNIKNLWWRMFVSMRDDMYGVDAAILMNPKVWEASGHTSGFADPSITCPKCGNAFRADHLFEEGETQKKCPECGTLLKKEESEQFNMMLATKVGAAKQSGSTTYLRPETAGGIFVNFKNVVDSMHPKLPFGIAQIGKAFRNEIAPRDFIFRLRELEQMEVEYFVRPEEWEAAFAEWQSLMWEFIKASGIDAEKVHELEVSDADRAHYSKRTIDFEFDWPFGRKELYGLAYRTDFDLKRHAEGSGVELSYIDQESNERIVPHVIEPSLGIDRTALAILCSTYREDDMGGDTRVYLALPKEIAPYRAAVFPLLKNKPDLVAKAKDVYRELKAEFPGAIAFDDNGNVGKRYRRQDEIGTPACITIDFQTLEDSTVTLRNRDTGEQERILINLLTSKLKN